MEAIAQRRCAHCKAPLKHDARSEEQRLEELKKNFGNVPVDDCDVVCTECYEKIVAWHKERN